MAVFAKGGSGVVWSWAGRAPHTALYCCFNYTTYIINLREAHAQRRTATALRSPERFYRVHACERFSDIICAWNAKRARARARHHRRAGAHCAGLICLTLCREARGREYCMRACSTSSVYKRHFMQKPRTHSKRMASSSSSLSGQPILCTPPVMRARRYIT